jgi:hypothetical protein
MTTTLYATFDGEVLRPESALALTPNTRVRVTIEAGERPLGNAASFLRVAESLDLDGPADWAGRLDHYLYGGGEEGDA